jgi:hypothetical protein
MGQHISHLTKHPRLLVSTLLISTPIAYLIYLHKTLSQTTHHVQRRGRLTPLTAPNITSIPDSAFRSEHHMIHDLASKSIPASRIPSLSQQELLVLYLRHTMRLFSSRFPQAYMLRLISPKEDRISFASKYISNLEFIEGDLVCGMYRVVARTACTVEFEMKPVGIVKGGRMVVGVERNGEEWVCSSKTLMWKDAAEKGLMPLELRAMRWLHELAAWWLLDSGTRFLRGLKKTC